MVSGYLIPGRRLDVGHVRHSDRGVFLVRRLARESPRRSSLTVMWGIVSTSCRRKSICDPCIRPAIMMVKPTPMAHARTCRPAFGERGCSHGSHAMLSKRFVAIGLTVDWLTYLDGLSGRRVFSDVPAGIVHDGINVSR